MPPRNDKTAVAKAAKAVDRADVVALLQLTVRKALVEAATKAARLSRMAADPLSYAPEGRAAYPIGDPRSGFGEDGELRVGRSPQPMVRPARRRPRRAAGDLRIVRLTGRGAWPRYGTARYAKADFVRQRIRANDEAAKQTHVYQLVGAFYDGNARLTLHDLEVMVEKNLISMEDAQ